MREQHVATCRYCGAQGIEDADDICPGVCPGCFDARLGDIMAHVEPPVMANEQALLLELAGIGMTDAAARMYVDGLVRIEKET